MWFFIVKLTIIWFIVLFLLSNLTRWLFGYAKVDFSIVSALFQLALGFVVGSITWVINEKRFKSYPVDKNEDEYSNQ